MDIWLYALILSAFLVSSVLLFKNFKGKKKSKQHFPELETYLASLSDLLKNKEDASVSQLLEALPLSLETIDTHLAFGEYLRRRGEVDKAVAVHNHIVDAKLSDMAVCQATLALALDFKQSGLFDRAESLLKSVLSQLDKQSDKTRGHEFKWTLRTKALNTLVDLYQEGQEWEQAITAIDDLRDLQATARSKVSAARQAHFCCELALAAKDDQVEAKRWLERALLCDPNHVRAALLKNSLMLEGVSSAHHKPFRSWEKLLTDAPEIWKTLNKMALPNAARVQLNEAVVAVFKKTETLYLAEPTIRYLTDQGRLAESRKLLSDTLAKHGVYRSFDSVIDAVPDAKFAPMVDDLVSMIQPVLTCKKCGFETVEFFWCCPTCKDWR